MSDPIITIRLREVELDYVLNGFPDEEDFQTEESLIAAYQKYVDTVLDLIDDGVDEQ